MENKLPSIAAKAAFFMFKQMANALIKKCQAYGHLHVNNKNKKGYIASNIDAEDMGVRDVRQGPKKQRAKMIDQLDKKQKKDQIKVMKQQRSIGEVLHELDEKKLIASHVETGIMTCTSFRNILKSRWNHCRTLKADTVREIIWDIEEDESNKSRISLAHQHLKDSRGRGYKRGVILFKGIDEFGSELALRPWKRVKLNP